MQKKKEIIMNQILITKSNANNNKEKKIAKINHFKGKLFKIQFILSIFLFFIAILGYFLNYQTKNSKEKISKQIANNYNISKLYNNDNYNSTIYHQNKQTFAVIGMIEIPKINIYYPIISEANDELLKISPCRISGPMPNEDGNLCIAGHNYDNYKFFSQVSNLNKTDEIIIYDISGNKLSYKVSNVYEVLANDLSPLEMSGTAKKQVTLVTCNNFNSNTRIIIKALFN